MIARDINADKSKYLIENFDKALQDGWIEVYYQPIIRTSNGSVCDEEAFVRWDDPYLGILNAAEFVPVLEAVNLIHRMDLYVLEQVLMKMEQQMELGLYVVPTSVNLSQIDFFCCDIVEEFNKRVSKSKIPTDKIAIEIAAGAIGNNNEQIITALNRFSEYGFKIWMDDYGYGETSPAILQLVKFDLLKLNMFYTSQIITNNSTRIIIAELIRMAIALGIETAAECIENKLQIEFLEEIGCTKMQGFFFCRPVSKAQVFERYHEGKAIGFENPKETDYYSSVGKINLYDLAFTKDKNFDSDVNDYFETVPVAICEVSEDGLSIMRVNKSFRRFLTINFPDKEKVTNVKFKGKEKSAGYYTINSIKICAKNGGKLVIDDLTRDGRTVHILLKRIAINEVSNKSAVALVLLSVGEKSLSKDILNYNFIARALSEDYLYMYIVDNKNNEFVEYSQEGLVQEVSVSRKGIDFWQTMAEEYKEKVFSEDHDVFKESFTKDNVMNDIAQNGVFKLAYRIMIGNKPTYVSMKAVKVNGNKDRIIIGVNSVEAQMRQKEEVDRLKEEKAIFSRLTALTGDYIALYVVNPNDYTYKLYKSEARYESLGSSTSGDDFYYDVHEKVKELAYSEDLDGLIKFFTPKNVMEQISKTGLFVYNYRLLINGMPRYVCLKAALVHEDDGPQLIVGVIDVDSQVRKELEYAENLLIAENKASRDELTGVKNKRAYVEFENNINDLLKTQPSTKLAIVVCDINGLKEINDTKGHQAGDEFIKNGCTMICNIFSHSPVYRIGGDEFVVSIQGLDYDRLDSLFERLESINMANMSMESVTVAYGYSKNMTDKNVADIFKRADDNMYKKKEIMKKQMAARKEGII